MSCVEESKNISDQREQTREKTLEKHASVHVTVLNSRLRMRNKHMLFILRRDAFFYKIHMMIVDIYNLKVVNIYIKLKNTNNQS